MALAIVATPSSAHRSETNRVEVCTTELRMETVVEELFSGSGEFADLVMIFQRRNQALQEIFFGSYNFKSTGVGNQVVRFDQPIAIPAAVQNDFKSALRDGEILDLDLVWRGLTLGQTQTYETVSTTLLACDSIQFERPQIVLPSGTERATFAVVRDSIGRFDKVVWADVSSPSAGSCAAGAQFSFVDGLSLLEADRLPVRFPFDGVFFEEIELCENFSGPVTLTLEERVGERPTDPSAIVPPTKLVVSLEASGPPRQETLIFSNPLYEFNAAPAVGGFITNDGHVALVDILGDQPGRRDVTVEEDFSLPAFPDEVYLNRQVNQDLFSRSFRLETRLNIWAHTSQPTPTWSTWRYSVSGSAGIDFNVNAGGLDIPAGAVNLSNRSAFLVDDPPNIWAFTLDRHEFGSQFQAFPLGAGDGPAGLASLRDDRWAAAHSSGNMVYLTTFSSRGVLDQVMLDGVFDSFAMLPSGNRSDQFTVVGFEVVTNAPTFFYNQANTLGELSETVEFTPPDWSKPFRAAANADFVVDIRYPGPPNRANSDGRPAEAEGQVLEARVFDWQGNLVETLEIASDVTEPAGFLTEENELVVAYKRPSGIYATAFKLQDHVKTCVSDPHTLCLGRYRIQGIWADNEGNRKRADVFELTADTGFFTFVDPDNPEIFFKTVEDGCQFPGADPHTWLFAGGLTSLWSEWTIEDTFTGISRTYVNPGGRPYLAIRDVEALGNCTSVNSTTSAPPAADTRSIQTHNTRSPRPQAATFENCTETDAVACLNDGRFQVEIDYRVAGQAPSPGQMVRITGDGAYAWFFSPANVEVFVKILDACVLTDSFWLFAAGLTDVEVTLRVTDTTNGHQQVYSKPLGEAFAPIIDFVEFGCSP